MSKIDDVVKESLDNTDSICKGLLEKSGNTPTIQKAIEIGLMKVISIELSGIRKAMEKILELAEKAEEV